MPSTSSTSAESFGFHLISQLMYTAVCGFSRLSHNFRFCTCSNFQKHLRVAGSNALYFSVYPARIPISIRFKHTGTEANTFSMFTRIKTKLFFNKFEDSCKRGIRRNISFQIKIVRDIF